MSIATQSLTVTREADDKLRLEFDYDPAAVEFARSLPESRWYAKEKLWRCKCTPQALRRIRNESPLVPEFDGACVADIHNYRERLAMAHELAASELLSQPTVRKADSWSPQLKAYHFASWLPAAMIDVAMGGGKSKAVVDMVCNAGSTPTLILCPTSCMGVWRREFARHAGAGVDMLVLDKGLTSLRAVEADKFLRLSGRDPKIIVTNYEAASYRWKTHGRLASWLLGVKWDTIFCDEIHRIRNHATGVSQFAAKLTSERRYGLTGTVLPHSPADAFGQYRFLDPGIFGTSWTRFKQNYCIENPYIKGAIKGYKNQRDMAARMGEITIRITDEELKQNLPGITHIDLPCELSKEARRVYDKLERDFVAELNEATISVDNVLTKLLRLQQLTGGAVKFDDDDATSEIDDAKEKLLEDKLEDLAPHEPVVVFCQFTQDLRRVERVAAKLSRRYGELSGRRHDLTDHATYPPDIDVLGVQVQSGGVGIDLTRAAYVFAYSLGTLSPGDYDQLVKRVDRPGQSRRVTMYHLVATKTIDEALYAARVKRRAVIDEVLESMKGRSNVNSNGKAGQ